MDFWGPFSFGMVIGWVTYRTLRRNADKVAIGDIAAVISAIGGATVVGLFRASAFDAYCIGCGAGFFGYFIIGSLMDLAKPKGDAGTGGAGTWMGT